MRRVELPFAMILGLSVVCFWLSGCADLSPGAPASSAASPSPAVVTPTAAAAPQLIQGGRLSLLTDPGQSDSDQLSVGDLPDKANHLFQAGSSLVSTQLPVGFSQPYSATDFMNSEGSGFGAIYYKGADQNAEVAVAMRREEGLTQDQVDGVVNAYEQEFEKPNETVTGTIVNYYFWEDKPHNQRLMICSVASTKVKSRVDLTIALGDDTPMNKLGMDPVDAKRDRKAVEPAVAPVPG